MQLSSPKAITWWVTVVAALVGLVLYVLGGAAFATYGFGLLLLAFILLAVACVVNGL